MSCEYRRRKFLSLLLCGGTSGSDENVSQASQTSQATQVASFERIYQKAYDAERAVREEEQHAQKHIQNKNGGGNESGGKEDKGDKGDTGETGDGRSRTADEARQSEHRRKTHLLFGHMLRMGVPLPVHSSSGMPKPEAQAGYAALWDALKERITAGAANRDSGDNMAAGGSIATVVDRAERADSGGGFESAAGPVDRRILSASAHISDASDDATQQSQHPSVLSRADQSSAPLASLRSFSSSGSAAGSAGWEGPWLQGKGEEPHYDQEGYSSDGYDRHGYDRAGRDKHGYDQQGLNQDGYDRAGYDASGLDRAGYNREGWDSQGYNRRGFDKDGWDRDGFDWMGFDRTGFDRTGYNKHGYNRAGSDKDGYDRQGYDRKGYDRRGYNRQGLNARGVDRFGYSAQGTKDGFDKQGYNANSFDAAGYDRDGYNRGGYDSIGYTRAGRDRSGNAHAWWVPDRDGYYGDSCDRWGFDRDGYTISGTPGVAGAPGPKGADGSSIQGGRDRWGFDRQGFNERNIDREGYNREGYDLSHLDREQYNQAGYSAEGYDRLGYNMHGRDRSGRSVTGYNRDGYDAKGIDRWGRDHNNRDARTGRLYKTSPYNKSGFDKEGYDRWGFHRDTGLTADGRNYAGWVYNPQTGKCHEPSQTSYTPANSDPSNTSSASTDRPIPRSMPHTYHQDGRGVQWLRPKWDTRVEWDPGVAPTWNPRAPLTWEAYARANGLSTPVSGPSSGTGQGIFPGGHRAATYEHVRRSYESCLNHQPNLEERWQTARAQLDPHAALNGVPARCSRCGQFTGYRAHTCPAFGGRSVVVYRSGLARLEGSGSGISATGLLPNYIQPGDDYSDRGVHIDTRLTMDGCYPAQANTSTGTYGPFANGYSEAAPRRAEGVEARDPAYSNGGYNRTGYDPDGADRLGRDRRGRDAEGYDRAGYDWLGRDRDGYDRHGHDRNGRNRAGVSRPRSLQDLASDYATPGMEGDVVANEGVRHLYSQIASSLAGSHRNVVFREGEGFATDMQGTIYLDPYPLGREAPPVYNAAVVMEGLQHEMGHELETPLDTFRRIIEVASSPDPVEGLDQGRSIVKNVYNIVEDGRMERRISALPGVAEYLAVGCKLQPRWDEKVGEGVPASHEIQGALLYEALPFYQVRPEVLDSMTPSSRALFEDLRPVVHQGVFGSSEDAYRASIEIARRLQDEGIADAAAQLRVPAPASFSFAGASQGDAGNNGQGNGNESRDGSAGNAGSQNGSLPSNSNGGQLGTGSGASAGSAGGSATGSPSSSESMPGATGGPGSSTDGKSDSDGQAGNGRNESGSAFPGKDPRPAQRSGQGAQVLPPSKNVAQPPAQEPNLPASPLAGPGAPDAAASEQGSANPSNPSNSTNPSTSNPSAPGDPRLPFSDAQTRQVLDDLERDLAAAVESDIRRQSRVEVLGRNLHKPLASRNDAQQVYRDSHGRVRSAQVQFPGSPGSSAASETSLSQLQKRRGTQRQLARQLARYLENVQDASEETLNFQSTGKLDRHRFSAAMKDAPDVYRRRVEVDGPGFALSMAVDMSGSMSKEMRSGALCDAAMVVSDACEEISMPYEVRAFSSRTYQYKAMDDPAFSLDRAAMLINGEGGGTNMCQTAGLAATSLLARPERNKLFVSLTDGDLGDHDSTMRQMEQARRDGVFTFGIFLSRGGYVNRDRMDQIYGKANWASIRSIQEMPRVVGQRIALLMRRAR